MTTTYIKQILDQVNLVTNACGPVLLFGENIDTGSRIAGLARGLTVNPQGKILNVGNCELTHCGVGFGMMLDRGQSVLFMKQLDFLLLGLDQLVNTYNSIRSGRRPDDVGSFTIFLIVCDQGYQGPQSSINSASDVASLANVDVYCINGSADAARVVADKFVAPGFRVICLSQKLFGAPSLDTPAEWNSADNALFRYRSGGDVTIACYNFALRPGVEIADKLAAAGVKADLFHVNYLPGGDMSALAESCSRTGRLVILDDSRTVTKFGDMFIANHLAGKKVQVLNLTRRGSTPETYGVDPDLFQPDFEAIAGFAKRPAA